MRLHTGDKPFECKVCLKKYVTLSNLQQHEQVHISKVTIFKTKFINFNQQNRQKHYCPVEDCQKYFYHKCSLNKHVQRVHADFELTESPKMLSKSSIILDKPKRTKGIYSLYS
jgi:hypothetical protein